MGRFLRGFEFMANMAGLFAWMLIDAGAPDGWPFGALVGAANATEGSQRLRAKTARPCNAALSAFCSYSITSSAQEVRRHGEADRLRGLVVDYQSAGTWRAGSPADQPASRPLRMADIRSLLLPTAVGIGSVTDEPTGVHG
jgi:hypothetical protein